MIHYDDYVKCGGAAQAKAEGKLKIQGADYVVNDGIASQLPSCSSLYTHR